MKVASSYAGIEWQVLAAQIQQPLPLEPFQRWVLPNHQQWCWFYKQAHSYLLRFPTLADFSVSLDGRKVSAFPTPTTDIVTLEHLFLNQVVPLALSRQDQLVLHASAIAVDGKAVAFLGKSGQGKSTLATSFALSGFPLVSDDGLQLLQQEGQWWVRPGHPSIRLWADSSEQLVPHLQTQGISTSYNAKLRIHGDEQINYFSQTLPLAALFVMAEQTSDLIAINSLQGHAAVMALIANSFVLDVEEKRFLTLHFTELTKIAMQKPMLSLQYPRHYDLLPQVQAAILEQVQALS